LLPVLALTMVFGPLSALSAQAAAPRSTTDGVYTAAQAKSGGDLYTMLCQSCHAAISHTGEPFRNKWVGRTLGDLFAYIREEMPKTEPGSLSEEEYTLVLAYILRMNGMPAGRRALDPNDGTMARIRINLPTSSQQESGSLPHARFPR
jgi:mono/diheme cytochrome c family protein